MRSTATIDECKDWPEILNRRRWRTAKGVLALLVPSGIGRMIEEAERWHTGIRWADFEWLVANGDSRSLEVFYRDHIRSGVDLLDKIARRAWGYRGVVKRIPLQGAEAGRVAAETALAAEVVSSMFKHFAGNSSGNNWHIAGRAGRVEE